MKTLNNTAMSNRLANGWNRQIDSLRQTMVWNPKLKPNQQIREPQQNLGE